MSESVIGRANIQVFEIGMFLNDMGLKRLRKQRKLAWQGCMTARQALGVLALKMLVGLFTSSITE